MQLELVVPEQLAVEMPNVGRLAVLVSDIPPGLVEEVVCLVVAWTGHLQVAPYHVGTGKGDAHLQWAA